MEVTKETTKGELLTAVKLNQNSLGLQGWENNAAAGCLDALTQQKTDTQAQCFLTPDLEIRSLLTRVPARREKRA